ncbi:MAG: GNAT family N-acetyltransferase [Pyrinomonadaceae bacterium]
MADAPSEFEMPDLSNVSISVDDEVVLRRVRPDEAEKVFETVIRNTERLLDFMHWMTRDYSLTMAEEFVERSKEAAEKGESLSLGIFRGETFIGVIGFVGFDRSVRKTEIGYWIDGDEEGKGIVSRATRSLIDLAFDEFSINRIEIRCATSNPRSAAVPRRFGFTEEARLRQSEIRNGVLQDFNVFGLLRPEWKCEDHA